MMLHRHFEKEAAVKEPETEETKREDFVSEVFPTEQETKRGRKKKSE